MRNNLPHLPPLYPHQVLAIEDCLGREDNVCYSAPTGSGKTHCMLQVHVARPDSLLISPSLTILGGMLNKLTGANPATLSEKAFEAMCLENRMATPIKVRNVLAAGQLDPLPGLWQFDEAHHSLADTYTLISAMCPGRRVGWTATPFRGSPKATVAWRKLWGDIVPVLTYPEAAAGGFISIPTPTVQPLADDDQLAISNGDFTVTSAANLMHSRLDDLVEISRPWCKVAWDRPTGYVVPSVEIARDLTSRLETPGLPAALIDADTPWAERQAILAANLRREVAVVSVGVLAEGVDHAFRRLVDCAPTMSPVRALQIWGRVMRPVAVGEPPPALVCCNRNIERHLYLLSGCWPSSVLAQAQKAFGAVSKRVGARVLGLESLGRLKVTELPLADDSKGLMWCFARTEGPAAVRQYAVLLHPASSEPIVASRLNADGTYGTWESAELPDMDGGWASVPASTVTEKQRAWWHRAAARHGLDPDFEPDRRQFAALPVLSNLNLRLVTEA
jgi:superfamily II DNA or RNA helicase